MEMSVLRVRFFALQVIGSKNRLQREQSKMPCPFADTMGLRSHISAYQQFSVIFSTEVGPNSSVHVRNKTVSLT